MRKLRINDEVIIRSGKDRGKTGKIAKLFWNRNKVVVSGINLVKKTTKPTQENPTGGISEIESSVDLSNVALVSPKTKKATRVRIDKKDGKSVRVAVSCGTEIK